MIYPLLETTKTRLAITFIICCYRFHHTMLWYIYGVNVTIAHYPLFVDCLRFTFPHLKLPRVGDWCKYVMLVVAGIIMFTVLWQLVYVFLPLYVPDPLHSVKGLLHITFAMWMWINVFVNYFHALLIPPIIDESPDRDFQPPPSSRSSDENSIQYPNSDLRIRAGENGGWSEGRNNASSKFSKEPIPKDGMHWKPSRGNYCKMCGIRVAYVDHHCPYLGACFGLHNYSYFYMGILYGLLGGVYAFVLSGPCFWECDVKYFLAYLNIMDSAGLEVDMCVQVGTQSRMFILVVFALYMVGMMFLAQNVFLLVDVSTFNIIKYSSKVPVLLFMWQRIKGRKFLERNSRLNILLLSQRARWYHFLIPVRNIRPSVSHSMVYSV